jgi:hypothetical protein
MLKARWMMALAVCAGCGGDDGHMHAQHDASIDSTPSICTSGDRSKIKFTKDQGCSNDGSVEFCIPMGNATVMSSVTSISASITCAAGGGRAMCTGSELLCFYPTTAPDQCVETHGAMTEAAWSDMCELSAIPEIDQILPTIVP